LLKHDLLLLYGRASFPIDVLYDGLTICSDRFAIGGMASALNLTQKRRQAIVAELSRFGSRVPTGRVADPDESASAAVFLASDNSSFVAGVPDQGDRQDHRDAVRDHPDDHRRCRDALPDAGGQLRRLCRV